MEKLNDEYNAKLSLVNAKIRTLQDQIDGLKRQKRILLTKIKDVDMDLVLQYIVERGLTSTEVMEMIDSAEAAGEV